MVRAAFCNPPPFFPLKTVVQNDNIGSVLIILLQNHEKAVLDTLKYPNSLDLEIWDGQIVSFRSEDVLIET